MPEEIKNVLDTINPIFSENNIKVVGVHRLNNSINGNPKYKFVFSGAGVATTPSDAGWVYSFSTDTFIGKNVDITYRYTKKGKCILESIKGV